MDNNYNNQNYQPNMNNMPPYPNQDPQQPMMGQQPLMGQQPVMGQMPQQGMAQSVIPQPGVFDTQATMPQMAPQQVYINNAPMYQEPLQPQQPQQEFYQPPLIDNPAPAPAAPKKSNKKIVFIIIGAVVALGIIGFVISLIMGMSKTTNYLDTSRQNAYVDLAGQYVKYSMREVSILGLDTISDESLLIFMPVGHEGNTCVLLESGGQSPFDSTWKMAYVAMKFNGSGFDYYFGGYDGKDTGIRFTKYDELKAESVEKNLKGYAQSLQDLYSGSLSLKKTAVSELEDDDLTEFAYTVDAQNIVVLSKDACTK